MNPEDIVVGKTYRGPAEGLNKRGGKLIDYTVYNIEPDGSKTGVTLVTYWHKNYRRGGTNWGCQNLVFFAAWAMEEVPGPPNTEERVSEYQKEMSELQHFQNRSFAAAMDPRLAAAIDPTLVAASESTVTAAAESDLTRHIGVQ